MYLNRFMTLLILAVASDANGVEISVTDELVDSEIEFYTQSEAGQLITCGVEFSGIDSKLNIFSGSFGFLYSEARGPVPTLKVSSLKMELNGAFERKRIKKAWLKSGSSSTLSDSWVADNEGESYLLVGSDVIEGGKLYADIVAGENVKIGYLHEGETIDRVYRLKQFSEIGDQVSSTCVLEMIESFINK